MKENLRAFRIWAPDDALWTAWAKPVLFANAAQWENARYWKEGTALDIPAIDWMPHFANDTAVIVDLPGKRGVEEALGLAQLGFRPVPLYNGTCASVGARMLVEVRDILGALFSGTNELAALSIPSNALPVFMLDANRMLDGKYPGMPGEYDNRWSVLPQDMPSAAYLLQQGIRKVIVRTHSGKISTDLSHVLCRYQEQKISILECPDTGMPRAMTVAKPSWFKNLFYRFGVIVGLRRNSSGGFGGVIPEPSSSGGSG